MPSCLQCRIETLLERLSQQQGSIVKCANYRKIENGEGGIYASSILLGRGEADFRRPSMHPRALQPPDLWIVCGRQR
jgi:hypothetical protein